MHLVVSMDYTIFDMEYKSSVLEHATYLIIYTVSYLFSLAWVMI